MPGKRFDRKFGAGLVRGLPEGPGVYLFRDEAGDALYVENELIRSLRPRYNVDGAFDFLYPAIGTGHTQHQLVLCLTTRIEAYEPLALRWHGVFRPRHRARDAFDALVLLLSRLGHPEPRSRMPRVLRLRRARERTGFADRFVPQARRDALFLEARRSEALRGDPG
jgi:hypothetical protein